MEQLEALNMLLRLIGSRPVNDIDTPLPAAANGRATLDRIRKKILKRGWWFNIDYGVEYQPNDYNEIIVPRDVSTILTSAGYVKRGNKLYDQYNNTYKFYSNVVANKTIRITEWDDMPSSMQEYCGYLAGAEFVRDEIEDSTKENSLKTDAVNAMMQVTKEDLEQGQLNMYRSSRILNARQGVRPYSRGHLRRFSGTPDR